MRRRAAVIVATWFVLSLGTVTASSSVAELADCVPLPTTEQGTFRRSDSPSYRLLLGSCVLRTTSAGQPGHDADYNVTSGGGASGRMLVSHDRACMGEENYPTSYDYTFTHQAAVLRLTLADQADFCSGREADVGRRAFVRVIAGAIRIVCRGSTSAGTFGATGAVTDSGRYEVSRRATYRKTRIVTLRLRGAKGSVGFRVLSPVMPRGARGSWAVVSNAGGYLGLTGSGRESGPLTGAHVRVVLTGRVTNI
jgi:hypothetical protein